jgi:LPPG:FO 2-phospho-L-lactate transferase
MVEVVHPADVTAIVNTGDDFVIHGLAVSPDLDTVTYTLADVVNVDTGWGLAGETWGAMDALDRFGPELTWFRLGDRDLATHLYRTRRRGEGAPLSTVTAEIGRAFGVGVQLLPATDDPVATRVDVSGEGEIDFQDYFVRRRHDVPVRGVRFDGADVARPGPGVLEALAAADRVVICPSNPIVSIDPILAVPGVRDAVVARRDAVVAVSPIVAGAALKGPAARLLADLGHDVSVVGVARLYAPLASVLVVDEADRWLAGAVEDEGLRCVVAPAVMRGRPEAVALAAAVLGA